MQSVRHNQGFRQVVSESNNQGDSANVYAGQRQTDRAARSVGSAAGLGIQRHSVGAATALQTQTIMAD